MKNEFKVLIVAVMLILQPIVFFGQLTITSRIVEKTTKKPIPFANIWIKDTNIGTTSNENGRFTFNVDSSYGTKSIIVSSIGYVDTLIRVSKLQSEVKLVQRIYQISEIKIFPRKRKELVVNDLSNVKILGGIMNDTTPQIVGYYYPYEQNYSNYQYVKSVMIYSRDTHKGKLNLRIYSFDTTNAVPVMELVHENIIVETRVSLFGNSRSIEVDLSKFNIVFPKNGLLVGIEWLIIPENRYNVTFSHPGKKKKIRTMYAPYLSATIEKNGYMYKYTGGVWSKPLKHPKIEGYQWSEHYFNPAISVKLTD